MSIKNIVITGMLFLAGTIASAQTSADQIKEKNMEKLELVKEWDKVFPQNQPVHLEVGMGKGRFLMDMAKLHPEINYIGIEMYDSVLLRAIQKKEALAEEGQELSNLKFMRMDARLLPEVFEKGEVSRIYLNFSDPWPKARHASRRLTSREFLSRYV